MTARRPRVALLYSKRTKVRYQLSDEGTSRGNELPCCPWCASLTQRVDLTSRRCVECGRVAILVIRHDVRDAVSWRMVAAV
jgi:ferredoxin-like protein FixX